MGDNNDGNHGDDPIPFAAPLPEKNGKFNSGGSSVIPVAIAAFIGALAGAVVGTQMG